MPSVEIPHGYGCVVGCVGLSFAVNFYLVFNVIQARKKYGVEYPALYAPESHKNAKEFNCVQRGHQNFLENWAPTLVLMLVNGLVYPYQTAVAGFVWCVGRVIYGYGYANGGPSGRMVGGLISHLGDFPLIVMTYFTATKLQGVN